MSEAIYLDHNATTPVLPEVAEAVREASLQYIANPDSQHEPGRQARRALETVREKIGNLLGAQMAGMEADRVVFTSGGTEANNLAVLGIGALAGENQGHLVTSAIEHPCVNEAIDQLQLAGWREDRALPTVDGVVPVSAIESLLRPNTKLVALMLANNETGAIQPVAKIAAICRERGILVHTDAAQAVGKIPVDFTGLGVHSLSMAAHKFGGPLGIGVLVLKHGLEPRPQLLGGHQQSGLRPGTQTVALAIGMQKALEISLARGSECSGRIGQLRDHFERAITTSLPSVTVLAVSGPRLPNTSNLAFVGLDRQALVMALDLAGVACSAGSACASGSSEPSPTLVAMGLEKRVIDASIRFSLAASTTPAEIDEAARRIINVCRQLELAGNP